MNFGERLTLRIYHSSIIHLLDPGRCTGENETLSACNGHIELQRVCCRRRDRGIIDTIRHYFAMEAGTGGIVNYDQQKTGDSC